ncbi:MAG: hypothetical protein WBQ94_12170 [Terracidiphilus sp.]
MFDDMIASPEGMPLPQNYDEFLDADDLHCILPGCDWSGHSLAGHLFQFHGITASEFKEAAGFNRKTGLVGKGTSDALAAGRDGPGFERVQNREVNYNPPLRKEGREHMRKSRLGHVVSEETKKKISDSNIRTKARVIMALEAEPKPTELNDAEDSTYGSAGKHGES